jgi:hypothetical protein
MCCVWIWEQTAIISLYSINWLVFITERGCVYCAVRTERLNIFQIKLTFERLSQRGCKLLGWSLKHTGCTSTSPLLMCFKDVSLYCLTNPLNRCTGQTEAYQRDTQWSQQLWLLVCGSSCQLLRHNKQLRDSWVRSCLTTCNSPVGLYTIQLRLVSGSLVCCVQLSLATKSGRRLRIQRYWSACGIHSCFEHVKNIWTCRTITHNKNKNIFSTHFMMPTFVHTCHTTRYD